MKTKRILSRTLAKELSPEDLDVINGAVAPEGFKTSLAGHSTLVLTLPSYSEDQ